MSIQCFKGADQNDIYEAWNSSSHKVSDEADDLYPTSVPYTTLYTALR